MRILSYILKRLFYLIPVLLGVTLLVFIISHAIPGDPARMMAGQKASREAVGQFKLDALKALIQGAGVDIAFAYGNAATDVWAFLRAGIPAARTFIIGKHGGEDGTNGVHDSWQPRATEVRTLPPVPQPFIR